MSDSGEVEFDIGINAVIQAADVPMYFADNEMNIKFYNEQLATVLCFKRYELDGKPVQTLVDRFVSLAPEDTREELRAKQDLLLELGVPDHCEEEHLIDLRKMVGNRYRGLQRLWISADRVYFPGPDDPIGLFVVYHPTRVDPDDS